MFLAVDTDSKKRKLSEDQEAVEPKKQENSH